MVGEDLLWCAPVTAKLPCGASALQGQPAPGDGGSASNDQTNCREPLIFRNLPFCEFALSKIAAWVQGVANLGFSRNKIFLKQTQIARVVAAMDHAVTVGAEHCKVGRHIVSHRDPLLQR